MFSNNMLGTWSARTGLGVLGGEEEGDCVGWDDGSRLGVWVDDTRRENELVCAAILLSVGIAAAATSQKYRD